MIDVIIWELKRRRTALFWWCVGSAVLSGMILLLFPSIRDQAHQLNQVINQLPQGVRELKTGGSNSVDVANPVQFLNSQLFYATLPILWIILAITRGGSVLGREEQSHTLELLLARPISRSRLLAAKGSALVLEMIIVGSAVLLTVLVLSPSVQLHIATGRLVAATAYTAAFCLSFGLIAFALQAASRLTRRAAVSVAVLIGFGGYVLTSLSGLTDWLKTPAKFAPFHYFAPDKILLGHSVVGLDIYLIGTLVLCSLIAWLGFRRRDIA